MSYFRLPAALVTVWVATEADTSDGGRAWIQVASGPDTAKQQCQARHDRERERDGLPLVPLDWHVDETCPVMHGQNAWLAQTSPTAFYEVRQTEVRLAESRASDMDSQATQAQRVWAACDASKAEVRPSWSSRDVTIHAIESFAEAWDTEFDFRIHDPNDVKELARWIGQHLESAGKLIEGREETT